MFKQIIWEDRVTQYKDRYRETQNPDGTFTHTRVEGEIIQQGTAHNIYSLPGEDPRGTITLDNFELYCKNKGPGHFSMTGPLWGLLANLCKKNSCQPYGNNYYGKDSRETAYQALPSTTDADGRTNRALTGTGPVSWSHDKTLEGIWDLNGNVWEWTPGIRLIKGELQAIPYNDAAHPDTDTSAASNAWRAINANALSYNDLYITPNGSGTTSNSVKMDYVSNHWQWGRTISSQDDSIRSAAFASTTSSSLSDFCMMYLRAMALLPEADDADYEGDVFYGNNGAEERCARRGGYWAAGAGSGVFSLDFGSPRSSSQAYVGGRPAFYE